MTLGMWKTPKHLKEVLGKYQEAERLLSLLVSESKELKASAKYARNVCKDIENMLIKIENLSTVANAFGDTRKRTAAFELYNDSVKGHNKIVEVEDKVKNILASAQLLTQYIDENRDIESLIK